MTRYLGSIHRWLGLAAITVFLGTGIYMRASHLENLPLDSGLRALFRSRHVYLLFAGLLNVAVGLGYKIPATGRGHRIAPLGSLLVMTSPILAAVAFVREPVGTGTSGPLSALAVFAAVLGMLFYELGAWRTGE